MFCHECGAGINEKAFVCIKYVCATANQLNQQAKSLKILEENKSLLIAYLLWFFFVFVSGHRCILPSKSRQRIHI